MKIVQGFALYYLKFSSWKGQRLPLEELIVTEQMRSYYMEKFLVDAITDELKQRKLQGFSWQVAETE